MGRFSGLSSSIIQSTISRFGFSPSNRSVLSCGGDRLYSAILKNEGRPTVRNPSTTILSQRILGIRDPKASIFPIVEQWDREGNYVDFSQIRILIKKLRHSKRYFHALQILDWLAKNSFCSLSSHDVSIRVDLITKVHGIEKAEDYFNNVLTSMKDLRVYGALLQCYSYTRSVEKAEALFQKMKELGFSLTTMSYNFMLNLYCKTGNAVKADTLMEEMCQKHINFDGYTYSIRHSAYAAAIDINGMEKILTRMESDPTVVLDWSTYTVMASDYKKIGLPEKALEMLKKSEGLIGSGSRSAAYNYLITQYAGLGKKNDVLRIWEHYKSKEKVFNAGYLHVLSSLVKVDDTEIAEKVFEEWESRKFFYDIRIPNVLIGSYARKGPVMKAEILIRKAISEGGKPSGMTYYHLAIGYLYDSQPVKAVEAMKKAVAYSGSREFKLRYESLAADLEHIIGRGDSEKAQAFVKLLGDSNIISSDIEDRLLNHIKCGSSNSDDQSDVLSALSDSSSSVGSERPEISSSKKESNAA